MREIKFNGEEYVRVRIKWPEGFDARLNNSVCWGVASAYGINYRTNPWNLSLFLEPWQRGFKSERNTNG